MSKNSQRYQCFSAKALKNFPIVVKVACFISPNFYLLATTKSPYPINNEIFARQNTYVSMPTILFLYLMFKVFFKKGIH